MLTIEKQNATQKATLTDTATVSRQQPKLLDRIGEVAGEILGNTASVLFFLQCNPATRKTDKPRFLRNVSRCAKLEITLLVPRAGIVASAVTRHSTRHG